MGFSTGFFGGFTLTASILYMTIQIHLANRYHQHLLLREQIDIINAIALPSISVHGLRNGDAAAAVMARRGYYPRGRPGAMELAKERWNAEVAGFVRRAHDVRWRDVWEQAREGWKALERLVKGS